MLKPTEDKEALLTPDEVEEAISNYFWCIGMPLDTGISRENYAVAIGQIEKLERLGYQRE